MATTTNMEMVLATVSSTLGPEWATLINAAFQVVDAHDHSDGKGVKVTPAGLDMNDALDMQNHDVQNISAVVLQALTAAATAKAGSLQRIGSNLYYVNGAGVAVQITSGSSIVSVGSGEITVDGPGAFPYSITTGDANKVLLVPTDSAANTLDLPAATSAMLVFVKDASSNAQTHNITVAPDGTDTIDGVNSSYVIDMNDACFGFISDGVSAWYVI